MIAVLLEGQTGSEDGIVEVARPQNGGQLILTGEGGSQLQTQVVVEGQCLIFQRIIDRRASTAPKTQ